MSSLPDDLSRFLFLVPYVAQREDGVAVEELCEHLSCTAGELHRLIERCALVGTPDGGPDEMVEIYLEGDRVHVALPQRFVRPPRFAVEETLALLVALAPLRKSALPSVRERAERLTGRLVELAGERAASLAPLLGRVTIHADGSENPSVLRVLEEAVRDQRAIDAEYYTAGRDALGRRTLHPVALVQARGEWYCVADDGKTYKVERFRHAALRAERFEATPPDLSAVRRRLESGRLDGELESIVVRIGEREERWPTAARAALRRFVRTQRGRAAIVSPEDARADVLADATALLDRYSEP